MLYGPDLGLQHAFHKLQDSLLRRCLKVDDLRRCLRIIVVRVCMSDREGAMLWCYERE